MIFSFGFEVNGNNSTEKENGDRVEKVQWPTICNLNIHFNWYTNCVSPNEWLNVYPGFELYSIAAFDQNVNAGMCVCVCEFAKGTNVWICTSAMQHLLELIEYSSYRHMPLKISYFLLNWLNVYVLCVSAKRNEIDVCIWWRVNGAAAKRCSHVALVWHG